MGLDTVELVIAFEKEFDFEINDNDAHNLLTPDDVANYVVKHSKHKYKPSVLIKVISITSKQLGLPKEEIRPSSLFVQDLGAD